MLFMCLVLALIDQSLWKVGRVERGETEGLIIILPAHFLTLVS